MNTECFKMHTDVTAAVLPIVWEVWSSPSGTSQSKSMERGNVSPNSQDNYCCSILF